MKGLTVDEVASFSQLKSKKLNIEIIGKTVGQVLDELANEAREEERRKEHAAAEEANLKNAIALNVVFQLPKHRARKGQISRSNADRSGIREQIRKGHPRIQGSHQFTDLFVNLICETDLRITEPMKVEEKRTFEGEVEFRCFNNRHRASRQTKHNDMKTLWVTKSVIYSDEAQIGRYTASHRL